MRLWFEIQLFKNAQLLVDGGLLDQPDWVFDLVVLAGTVYQTEMSKPVYVPKLEIPQKHKDKLGG